MTDTFIYREKVASPYLRQQMQAQWLADGQDILLDLLPLADIGEARGAVAARAESMFDAIRDDRVHRNYLERFLRYFPLSSPQTIALMALAEAMLRVPDHYSSDQLLKDKLTGVDWLSGASKIENWAVRLLASALHIGAWVLAENAPERGLQGRCRRLLRVGVRPLIRHAAQIGIQTMANEFVMAADIDGALRKAKKWQAQGHCFSYDILGEGARTMAGAERYMRGYLHAIARLGAAREGDDRPSISVKLSALHPRYSDPQRERIMIELVPKLKRLALQARNYDIALTIDAEEAARFDLALDVFEAVYRDSALQGWQGFGLAVQAYQKRTPQLIDYLAALAGELGRRINVRLVKGAYWDSEIKLAQTAGLAGYPVFTKKIETDVCYQACAAKLLQHRKLLYPQFATHNAWTVAWVLTRAKQEGATSADGDFEFQRLHGMGESLYTRLIRSDKVVCRVYAPVGPHRDLLAYLVRRLLENGANNSFVNQILADTFPKDILLSDPLIALRADYMARPAHRDHSIIPKPADIYQPSRQNSLGVDLSDRHALNTLRGELLAAWSCRKPGSGDIAVYNPADAQELVAHLQWDNAASLDDKLTRAQQAFVCHREWSMTKRAEFLQRLADGLERERADLIMLCVKEAGKTLADSVAELREAIDFCRYYAEQAQVLAAASNCGQPRGVILCISPWNFPLAIFIGQVAAALVTGNAVLAKPAEQTSLIAQKVLAILAALDLPADCVQLVLGAGPDLGPILTADTRIKGVMFTGSNATGAWLFKRLTNRRDALIPLLAETGGQNAMIVDSTALPEQVLDDVIRSGFLSAGQRCSALRVLYLQDDIADKLIAMLIGAMAELHIGDPAVIATDIGPVIDSNALAKLQQHLAYVAASSRARLLYQCELPLDLADGHFFAPCLVEITAMSDLIAEVFGPVVHVIRYQAGELEQVIADVNASGFGLTLGVHSRNTGISQQIATAAEVGNVYINRDMVGAVVGVQPFGGRGLSGTGPKAGGPLYLPSLMRYQGCDKPVPSDKRAPAKSLLRGPTGETNEYYLSARRQVHIIYSEADDPQECRDYCALATRLGCRVTALIPAAWQAEIEGASLSCDSAVALVSEDAFWRSDISCLILGPSALMLEAVVSQLNRLAGRIPVLVSEPLHSASWLRLVEEKLISTNTAAIGGNTRLLSLGGEEREQGASLDSGM
ncbi:bifunctional proline dehydrogenase/L-glutamate gamma-semialdehyde dehydrogenase PutA [Zhongshania sp.]|uniref:bifunctional proline dehydrogenase/L-glutamate gamma-semialdehyde dehydrogenase PutA n=1 Tax=Zhongshania sp. TaxID=1971902 RepID=UPI003561B7BD